MNLNETRHKYSGDINFDSVASRPIGFALYILTLLCVSDEQLASHSVELLIVLELPCGKNRDNE